MARIFGIIQVDGKRCRTLFDSGATNTYVAADVAKRLSRTRLLVPRPTGIGGKQRQAAEACLLMGKLEGKPIEVDAYVLDEIGRDDKGRPIDILFGALAMQKWNIVLVPKEERLDLSHYPEEFIEFPEMPAAPALRSRG
jgi:hypothetical protein